MGSQEGFEGIHLMEIICVTELDTGGCEFDSPGVFRGVLRHCNWNGRGRSSRTKGALTGLDGAVGESRRPRRNCRREQEAKTKPSAGAGGQDGAVDGSKGLRWSQERRGGHGVAWERPRGRRGREEGDAQSLDAEEDPAG